MLRSPEVAASFVEARLEGLVNELYAQLPQVHIFLATIPRLPPSSHAWRNYAKCESVGNSIRISGEKYNNLLRGAIVTIAYLPLGVLISVPPSLQCCSLMLLLPLLLPAPSPPNIV